MRAIFIGFALLLAACAKPAQESSQQGAFQVDNLFTHEGCTVYRFRDTGRLRYFTNCSGSTMSRSTTSTGKATTTYVDDVPGGRF